MGQTTSGAVGALNVARGLGGAIGARHAALCVARPAAMGRRIIPRRQARPGLTRWGRRD